MLKKIFYLGDERLDSAAAYLAGIMNHYGMPFDYLESAEIPGEDFTSCYPAVFVLSDYPADNLDQEQMDHIVQCVEQGSGFIMIGGWESFRGQSGMYPGTPIADILPVSMSSNDDRINCPQPCIVRKERSHEVVRGLPFETPPCIGGFNRLEAKSGATVILSTLGYSVRERAGRLDFEEGAKRPLLVLGEHGRGRTAALATDVAPHWVGGFVDWGDTRITANGGEREVEVGNWYARFFQNLLLWAGAMAR